MARKTQDSGRRSIERRSSNVTLWVTVSWFVVIALGAVVMRVQGLIGDAEFYLGLGAVALIAPVGILIAWRAGEGVASEMRRSQQMRELVKSIDTLVQEGGLSEVAKRVLHRREERELLRNAIEQDINDEDWDAAMVLVKELAERFGYRADAEEFRKRVERARAQTLDRTVVDALGVLDELIRHQQWPESYAESARITRLFPESHRVDNLRARVDEARMRYQKDLERRFLLAAEQEHLEEAMAMLKELDAYLTPTEAGPFQEVARGVIGKHRENLGVRFKLAMQDQHWDHAVTSGEQIIEAFPNSRMAQEVRELLPSLRERGEGRTRSAASRV